jgi:hypothetical protein
MLYAKDGLVCPIDALYIVWADVVKKITTARGVDLCCSAPESPIIRAQTGICARNA